MTTTTREEFFTASGGHVLLDPEHYISAGAEARPAIGITSVTPLDDDDLNIDFTVDLEDTERLRIATWLLERTLDEWEMAWARRFIVHAQRRLGEAVEYPRALVPPAVDAATAAEVEPF